MRTLTIIALWSLVSPNAVGQDDSIIAPWPCDLRKLEKANYCASCAEVDPKLDRKGFCVYCGEAATRIEVCVRVGHRCNGCGAEFAKDKSCCAGEVAQRVQVKARVVFCCTACGIIADEPGVCQDSPCRNAIRPRKKTCSWSRYWPHGGLPTTQRGT